MFPTKHDRDGGIALAVGFGAAVVTGHVIALAEPAVTARRRRPLRWASLAQSSACRSPAR
jgi:hypothetical protein